MHMLLGWNPIQMHADNIISYLGVCIYNSRTTIVNIKFLLHFDIVSSIVSSKSATPHIARSNALQISSGLYLVVVSLGL